MIRVTKKLLREMAEAGTDWRRDEVRAAERNASLLSKQAQEWAAHARHLKVIHKALTSGKVFWWNRVPIVMVKRGASRWYTSLHDASRYSAKSLDPYRAVKYEPRRNEMSYYASGYGTRVKNVLPGRADESAARWIVDGELGWGAYDR